MSGVYRIRASDFSVFSIKGRSCSECRVKFPEAIEIAELFRKHGNLDMIIDEKDSKFLKGGFSEGQPVGARIRVLPDGRCLNKMFSLFAPGLRVHDERSNIHWDVIYRNNDGSCSYVYTVEKENSARKAKYEKVRGFRKRLPRLNRNLKRALGRDVLALPMLILLKTKMRVGNEIYYKKNHHKGLTTLKKKNIRINGREVSFDFIGKDGVPQNIVEVFPEEIINELKIVLGEIGSDDFVFVDLNGRPLKDIAFERGFEKYCGVKFYPHIVRSDYATREAEKFLRRKKMSSDDVREFYMRVADKLGHKKFSKKTGNWEDCYQVTLHHYIRPDLVERLSSLCV